MRRDKTKKNRIVALCAVAVILIGIITTLVIGITQNKTSVEIDVNGAQKIVYDTFNGIVPKTATGTKAIMEKMQLTVKDIEYGNEKNIILSCSYSVPDVKTAVQENKNAIIESTYAFFAESERQPNATKIKQHVSEDMLKYLEGTPMLSGDVTLILYEISDGSLKMYLDEKTVDTVTGGLITAENIINGITSVNYKGEVIDITNSTTIRTGIKDCLGLSNYDSAKPDTSNKIVVWFRDLADEFKRNFVNNDQWMYLVQGLGTTLAITLCAGVMGIVLGFIVAIIRCTHDTNGNFYILDKICRFYLTVVRGTPVMVQLLIIYFVLLLPIGVPKFISAVLCFGLNSGAYVAEIVRGGIMSVDAGQNEAGRSLGFNFAQTMMYFIIPQAFKAVLPSLANEFITLLKESSVAFYIGVADLTQGGLKIRSITYSNFMPLIAVALIYLAIVLILTWLVGKLERRLRKSER